MSKYPGRIVSNLAPAGYSVFFDGTGDYLSVANNAALQFGSGDFTIEFWWYPNVTSDQNLISKWNSSTEWILQWRSAGNFRWAANGSVVRDANYTLSTGAWIHVAVSCASTNLRIFVNGAQIGTTATQSSITNTSEAVTIGAGQISSTPLAVNGYISNVRIIKGTALYTAAFTPPTQLFNVTNTSLLTCNSPAIVDQSTNNFAITANGNAAVSTFTPFTAYVPYNPALGASTPGIWTVDEAMQAAATRQWNMYDPSFNLTTLLLHGNGTNGAQNNTFLDSSSNNFTITRNGNTTQGSLSPFSQTGWSTYFDGSGDSFSVSTSTVLDLNGAIDFTIEAWVYLTGYGSTSDMSLNIANKFTGAGGLGYTYGIFGGGANQGKIQFYGAAGSVSIISTNVIPLNSWNHVAIVKSGTTYTHYLNGVANGSQTTATTLTASANALVIGDYGYADDFLGYMSNLRITKNGAVYTSGFTPPTSPLTTSVSAGTVSLLTFQSNRFVDNSSNGFTLTPSGTPSVQPFSPFYPTAAYTPQTIGGSGYFDGTGDYLTKSNINFSTNAFTIEGWFYLTSTANNINYWGESNGGGSNPKVLLYMDTANLAFELGTAGGTVVFTPISNVRRNAWQHIVICRSGTGTNQTAMFLDGQRVSAGTSGNLATSTGTFNVGYMGEPYGTLFTGYIASFRVVNGTDVYGAGNTTITVPTAPVTNVSNTNILLNFTNAGVVDSTAKIELETVAGASISTTQSRFGGSSLFFNGTTDKLITTRSPLFNFGASDFTVEGWFYTGSSATMLPIYSMLNGAKADVFAIQISGGIVYAYVTASGGATWSILNGTIMGTVTLNAWNHIALVRNGSTWNGYLNGVRGSGFPVTNSSAISAIDGFTIGEAVGAGFWYSGYIDDLRFTRFARYTAAFTPQTSQWQDQ